MKKIIITIVVLVLLASSANAAQISFETSTTTVSVGDTVVFHVRLNTQGASVNAVDLGILYPGIFSVNNISKSGSFIQLWVKEPSYTNDVVFLSGGVPGGVSSDKATVATLTFQAKSVGDGALGLSPASAILLNDGAGTSVSISLQTPTIHVVPRKSGQAPKTTEQDITTKQTGSDFINPEGFSLNIASDGRLFSGKHFVSFFTTDSGSGVDHYKLKEGDGPYVLARSPYLLADQNLHSVIHVRAYDVAGNYREEVYPGLFMRLWWWITKLIHL
jgi:hypothetical protein